LVSDLKHNGIHLSSLYFIISVRDKKEK
jgi:hypothetical protein